MNYTVLRAHMLKEKLAHQRFESVAVAGRKILLGTADGNLLVYAIQEDPSSSEPFRLTGVDCRPGFADRLVERGGKKGIAQLVAIPELDLLLSLVDSTILEHRLSDLTPQVALRATKGCSIFAVKKEKGKFSLAANIKKKLIVMEYSTEVREFQQVRELALPDQPKTLNWAGKNVLLGYKREYAVLDVTSAQGIQTELFQTGKSQSPVACNSDALKELLLARENTGIRVNFDGRPTAKFGVTWNSIPVQVAYLHPYVVSMHEDVVEVHNPQKDQGCCQILPVKYIDRLSTPIYQNVDGALRGRGGQDRAVLSPTVAQEGGSVLNAEPLIATTSNNSIYLLEVVKFPDQLLELCHLRRFDDALSLYALLPAAELPANTLQEIHLLYALHLFSTRKFPESMKQFNHSLTDPRNVILLYGDLVPSGLLETMPRLPEAFRDAQRATSNIFAEPASRTSALSALAAYLRTQRKPLPDSFDPSHPELTPNGLLMASIDTTLLRAMIDAKEDDALITELLKGPNSCLQEDAEQILAAARKYVQLTALLNSRKLHQKALSMLQGLALHGDPQACLTKPSGDNPALDERLKQRFQDFAARGLELPEILRSLSGDSHLDGQVIGVVQTILYMQTLNGNDKALRDLIFQFGAWILQHIPPVYGLRMFWHDNAALLVPPYEVLQFFERQAQDTMDLCIAYTEMVTDGTLPCSRDTALHNRRIQLYLAKLEKLGVETTPESVTVQRKLQAFLKTSQDYNANSVIGTFSAPAFRDTLHSERVWVLRKMQRHDLALDILVHQRKNFDEAVKYCEGVVAATQQEKGGPPSPTPGGNKDVFVVLLESLLSDKTNPDGTRRQPRVEEALRVLTKHPDKMDPIKVMALLPDSTPIPSVSSWIVAVLRTQSALQRHFDVTARCHEVQAIKLREDLLEVQKDYVVITGSTRCDKCSRTIQDSVFVRYPNGKIVHQACVGEDDRMCPVTLQRFNEFDRFK